MSPEEANLLYGNQMFLLDEAQRQREAGNEEKAQELAGEAEKIEARLATVDWPTNA